MDTENSKTNESKKFIYQFTDNKMKDKKSTYHQRKDSKLLMT